MIVKEINGKKVEMFTIEEARLKMIAQDPDELTEDFDLAEELTFHHDDEVGSIFEGEMETIMTDENNVITHMSERAIEILMTL